MSGAATAESGNASKRGRDGYPLVLGGVPMLSSPAWSSDDEMDNAEFNRNFRLKRYAAIREENKAKVHEAKRRRRAGNVDIDGETSSQAALPDTASHNSAPAAAAAAQQRHKTKTSADADGAVVTLQRPRVPVSPPEVRVPAGAPAAEAAITVAPISHGDTHAHTPRRSTASASNGATSYVAHTDTENYDDYAYVKSLQLQQNPQPPSLPQPPQPAAAATLSTKSSASVFDLTLRGNSKAIRHYSGYDPMFLLYNPLSEDGSDEDESGRFRERMVATRAVVTVAEKPKTKRPASRPVSQHQKSGPHPRIGKPRLNVTPQGSSSTLGKSAQAPSQVPQLLRGYGPQQSFNQPIFPATPPPTEPIHSRNDVSRRPKARAAAAVVVPLSLRGPIVSPPSDMAERLQRSEDAKDAMRTTTNNSSSTEDEAVAAPLASPSSLRRGARDETQSATRGVGGHALQTPSVAAPGATVAESSLMVQVSSVRHRAGSRGGAGPNGSVPTPRRSAPTPNDTRRASPGSSAFLLTEAGAFANTGPAKGTASTAALVRPAHRESVPPSRQAHTPSSTAQTSAGGAARSIAPSRSLGDSDGDPYFVLDWATLSPTGSQPTATTGVTLPSAPTSRTSSSNGGHAFSLVDAPFSGAPGQSAPLEYDLPGGVMSDDGHEFVLHVLRDVGPATPQDKEPQQQGPAHSRVEGQVGDAAMRFLPRGGRQRPSPAQHQVPQEPPQRHLHTGRISSAGDDIDDSAAAGPRHMYFSFTAEYFGMPQLDDTVTGESPPAPLAVERGSMTIPGAWGTSSSAPVVVSSSRAANNGGASPEASLAARRRRHGTDSTQRYNMVHGNHDGSNGGGHGSRTRGPTAVTSALSTAASSNGSADGNDHSVSEVRNPMSATGTAGRTSPGVRRGYSNLNYSMFSSVALDGSGDHGKVVSAASGGGGGGGGEVRPGKGSRRLGATPLDDSVLAQDYLGLEVDGETSGGVSIDDLDGDNTVNAEAGGARALSSAGAARKASAPLSVPAKGGHRSQQHASSSGWFNSGLLFRMPAGAGVPTPAPSVAASVKKGPTNKANSGARGPSSAAQPLSPAGSPTRTPEKTWTESPPQTPLREQPQEQQRESRRANPAALTTTAATTAKVTTTAPRSGAKSPTNSDIGQNITGSTASPHRAALRANTTTAEYYVPDIAGIQDQPLGRLPSTLSGSIAIVAHTTATVAPYTGPSPSIRPAALPPLQIPRAIATTEQRYFYVNSQAINDDDYERMKQIQRSSAEQSQRPSGEQSPCPSGVGGAVTAGASRTKSPAAATTTTAIHGHSGSDNRASLNNSALSGHITAATREMSELLLDAQSHASEGVSSSQSNAEQRRILHKDAHTARVRRAGLHGATPTRPGPLESEMLSRQYYAAKSAPPSTSYGTEATSGGGGSSAVEPLTSFELHVPNSNNSRARGKGRGSAAHAG